MYRAKRIVEHLIRYLNIRTLIFNFKYFPFSTAILLPVYISRKTWLNCVEGTIGINGQIRPGMISIGFGDIGIFDKERSRSIWEVRGKVIFNGPAEFGHGVKICVLKNGELIIGANMRITAESALVCEKKIVFGNDCLLSWDILVMDSDLHKIYEVNEKVINYPKAIYIGDHVWIGCRSTILKGVNIPGGCVVGSGSIVTGQFKNVNTIISGNPAVEKKQIHHWSDEIFSTFDTPE